MNKEKIKIWIKNNFFITLSILLLVVMNIICYANNGRILHLSTNVVMILLAMLNFGKKR